MTTALTILAIVISLGALAVSWLLGLRSARAAEKSEQHAKASAHAAERVARAEVDRDHEMYKPAQIGPESFVVEQNPRTNEEDLFCIFTPTRSYRISGESMNGSSPMALSMPLFNPAGVQVKVFIDVLNPIRDMSSKTELRLRFWPPADVDDRDLWTCRCERPLGSHEAPHWEMTVPVATPSQPGKTNVRWG
jgi:type II secretory pathway pseudopilin PulG